MRNMSEWNHTWSLLYEKRFTNIMLMPHMRLLLGWIANQWYDFHLCLFGCKIRILADTSKSRTKRSTHILLFFKKYIYDSNKHRMQTKLKE